MKWSPWLFICLTIVTSTTASKYHKAVHTGEDGQQKEAGNKACQTCGCQFTSPGMHKPPATSDDATCPSCFVAPKGLPDDTWHLLPPLSDPCFSKGQTNAKDCLPQIQGQAVYLFGDSHAFVMKDVLQSLMNQLNVPFASFTFASHEIAERSLPVVARFAEILKPKDVIVSCFLSLKDPHALWLLNQVKTIALTKGAKLVVMSDNPTLVANPIDCVRELPGKTSCAIPYSNSRFDSSTLGLSNSIMYVDIYDIFCKNGICDITIPGTNVVWIRDSNHLNIYGQKYALPFVCPWIQKALG
jgi:hypothetical protein